MSVNNKSGLSIILLIISIIVSIILSGAVILNLLQYNPIKQTSKTVFKTDLVGFRYELNVYNSEQYMFGEREYSSLRLQADETSVTYDGIVDTYKTINDLIPSLVKTPKYYDQFEVVNGKLVFKGTNLDEKVWAEEIGIGLIIESEFDITIISVGETVVKPGINIIYTIEFSSNAGINNVDLTDKVQIVYNNGAVLPAQPTLIIGTVTGVSSDYTRSVDVTIETDSLLNGQYKLKVKAGSAVNENNISNMTDTTSLTNFTIDNNVPVNPIILADVVTWTNGNVTVTINYSTDSAIKQYSINGTDWINYTIPINITTNSTTVYAKATDQAGNQSGQSTLTVANIDKVLPTVIYGTNGGSSDIASTTVTVSDVGGSDINTSTLQYVWDTQNTITPTSGWTVFTNGAILTSSNTSGTYYLWVTASDNSGNNLVTKSNLFTIIEPIMANAPVLTTGMTAKNWNGSSWVTIASPSTDTTWYNYADSQWANAQTADGSMWVWIPRYVYKISSLWHTSSTVGGTINIQFSEGTNDEWNSTVIGALNTGTGSSASNNTWTNHPAFTFGTTELEGIWVAKFEASNSSTKIKVVPNVAAWRSITMSTVFTTCRGMEIDSIYGWGTSGTGIDTHLMKNTEWGAIAYLSQSEYGLNGVQVWVNPDGSYTTGRAGASVSSYSTATASTYPYDDLTNGIKASTTGNIYGVYDMSGGSYEYTAAYVNSVHSNLATYSSTLVSAAAQYKDIYTGTTDTDLNNYANAATKKGDAMYETSSSYIGVTGWHGDNSYMPNTSTPIFVRGGEQSNGPSNRFIYFLGC